MNISHCLSNLDACKSRVLKDNLQLAEAALLQAVQTVAFSTMPDRPSQRQRDELQLELSRMVAAIAQLNCEMACEAIAPSGKNSPPSDSR